LIADDEPFNHESLKIILKSMKFKNIVSVFNGRECIEQVKKISLENKLLIRTVIMDIDMPIMDGI
jgi:CheY-like chemotaxis protein